MSDSEDQYVEEWANNQTSETLIVMGAFPFIPFLFYTQWNDTHFESFAYDSGIFCQILKYQVFI